MKKELALRSNTPKEMKRIIKAFKLAFEKDTDLNVRLKNEFIYYIGGILSKIDSSGKQFIAVGNKFVSV